MECLKKSSCKQGLFFFLFGIFLLASQSARATFIDYDINFFDTGFAQASEFSGGFTYDDTTQFVSNFNVDMDVFGQVNLAFSVPAASLNLSTPPGLAFNDLLFVSLSGGNAGVCVNGCNAAFNTTNVFSLLDDFFNPIVLTSNTPIPNNGFYQVLPSTVPEPPMLVLLLIGVVVMLSRKSHRFI